MKNKSSLLKEKKDLWKKNKFFKEIIEISIRIYVSVFMFLYGFAKIIGYQFYTLRTIPNEVNLTPIGQISNFELAWVFMGRSYGFLITLGLIEITGALLLLINKTKIIGVIALIPVLIGVIIFDFFFLNEYAALFNAILYLMLIIMILFINIDCPRIFKYLFFSRKSSMNAEKNVLIKSILVIIITLLIYLLNLLFISI